LQKQERLVLLAQPVLLVLLVLQVQLALLELLERSKQRVLVELPKSSQPCRH
jgi:hypothetical protein